jgi:putative hydrolase of the HAD superfamily
MLLEGRMNPSETLFIDDGAKNIEAARRMGINVMQVNNGEDWRPLLEKTLMAYK